MTIFLSLREAVHSLAANKLRSALTILGIVIGVGAVISLMAIGRGTTSSITSSIEGIGTNLLFVQAGSAPGTTFTRVRNFRTLTEADAEALANPLAAPAVKAVAPILSSMMQVTYGSQSTNTTVTGVTPAYQTVRNLELAEGTFISDQNNTSRSLVAVIGADTADTLFGTTTNLVGQIIRIQGQQFHIIGVLKSKGSTSATSSDDIVLIPLTTAQTRLIRRFTSESVDSIYVEATSASTVNDAVAQVTSILAIRHDIKAGGTNDFSVRTQADMLSTAQSITGVLTIFLGGIAGISLVVGGIGIMNIMLVSVTERTKEIGLRKAIGARRRDILAQFLTESILLGLAGGVIGIAAAWGITEVVRVIAEANSSTINPQIGVDTILLATLFSMGVGLIFGLYPANRAATLQPVEALRFE